ncbi:hypothetical protein FHS20_002817 [Phyllobacterium endophyticum]|nr:hypothetical protein [Phyllobacterium endophyticum]
MGCNSVAQFSMRNSGSKAGRIGARALFLVVSAKQTAKTTTKTV